MSNPWRLVQITPGGPSISTSVSNEEIAVLGGLAFERDCLEIGSAWGYSAVMMALYKAKSVTAVDFHEPCDSNNDAENSYEVMQKHLKWFGVTDRVTIDRRDTREALPDLVSRGGKYGLIFVDAGHSYEDVTHDVGYARQLVAPGGYIASHDYGPDGIEGVTRALDEIYPQGPGILVGTLHVVQDAPTTTLP